MHGGEIEIEMKNAQIIDVVCINQVVKLSIQELVFFFFTGKNKIHPSAFTQAIGVFKRG